jgi:AcrR family transcriptional regulator
MSPASKRRPDKRAAILRGAREVFLRAGFSRATVEEIAADAGVSKPTVYNHFDGKDALFLAVVAETVAPVRAEVERLVALHLDDIDRTGLRGALVDFGQAWIRTSVLFPEHASLLRVVIAEAAHLPEVVDVWRRSGAGPSQEALARRLAALHRDGLIDAPDPATATRHLTALVVSPAQSRSFFGAQELSDAEVAELVQDGVDAFLRVHAPRRAQGARRGP